MTFLCPQVALLVAAEFWEQGDLERTVLDQQPIVSATSRIFYHDMWKRTLCSTPNLKDLGSWHLNLDL